MRYLTVQNFGTSLGVEGARLVVREHDGTVIEESLSRLRGIRIAKKGVSISSNLILECAARGIRIFSLTGVVMPFHLSFLREISTPSLQCEKRSSFAFIRQGALKFPLNSSKRKLKTSVLFFCISAKSCAMALLPTSVTAFKRLRSN